MSAYTCQNCGLDTPMNRPCPRCEPEDAVFLAAAKIIARLTQEIGELRHEMQRERLAHGETWKLLHPANPEPAPSGPFCLCGKPLVMAGALVCEECGKKPVTPPPSVQPGGESCPDGTHLDTQRLLDLIEPARMVGPNTCPHCNYKDYGYHSTNCERFAWLQLRERLQRSREIEKPPAGWRRYLANLREQHEAIVDLQKVGASFEFPEAEKLAKLEALDKLRVVVESGQGEAEVPESVRIILWPVKSGWAGQIKLKFDDGYPILRAPLDVRSVYKEQVLSAIDAAGAEIVGGGK